VRAGLVPHVHYRAPHTSSARVDRVHIEWLGPERRWTLLSASYRTTESLTAMAQAPEGAMGVSGE
jgi:hypothetical protein